MTAMAVDFKSNEELVQQRDALVHQSGLTLEELMARGEHYRLTVGQYAIFEEITDINYLLGE